MVEEEELEDDEELDDDDDVDVVVEGKGKKGNTVHNDMDQEKRKETQY